MTLRVIGAGFGRTGTESMKRALESLGFGPCLHMHEIIPSPSLTAQWRAIAAGGAPPDWRKVFEGYGATMDWPAAHFWRELSTCFPEAKIVLTVRSTESWYASMEKTILKVLRDPASDPDSIGMALLKRRLFGGNVTDRQHICDIYESHIAEVQAAFGPDRLLTYDLGSGWAPLCRHLNVPAPDAPFPSGNDATAFHKTLDRKTADRRAAEGEG